MGGVAGLAAAAGMGVEVTWMQANDFGIDGLKKIAGHPLTEPGYPVKTGEGPKGLEYRNDQEPDKGLVEGRGGTGHKPLIHDDPHVLYQSKAETRGEYQCYCGPAYLFLVGFEILKRAGEMNTARFALHDGNVTAPHGKANSTRFSTQLR